MSESLVWLIKHLGIGLSYNDGIYTELYILLQMLAKSDTIGGEELGGIE